MSAPYTGGLGCKSFYAVGGTAGMQLGVCGGAAAAAAGAAAIEGILHTITFSADSTANIVVVYDGLSTSSPILTKVINPTTTIPVTLTFNLQASTGLFVAISGMTSGAITIAYR